MSKKPQCSQDSKSELVLKLKDAQQNLEEFTRALAANIDFDTFDILSITRIDPAGGYKQSFAFYKSSTPFQSHKTTSSTSAEIIELPKKRFR